MRCLFYFVPGGRLPVAVAMPGCSLELIVIVWRGGEERGGSRKDCDLKCEKRNSPTSNRFEFIGYRVRPSGIPLLSVRGPAQAAGRECFLFRFRKRYTETLHVPRSRRADYVHAVLEFDGGQQQFVGPRPSCRIVYNGVLQTCFM